LGRSPSTISRVCRRSSTERSGYKAQAAQRCSVELRKKPHITRKLDDAALWETVQALLRAR
jgi:IS30 family transposase